MYYNNYYVCLLCTYFDCNSKDNMMIVKDDMNDTLPVRNRIMMISNCVRGSDFGDKR